MTDAQLGIVVQHVRGVAGEQTLAEATDGELAERLSGGHDHAAFAVLLRRHGPMVLNVCRRLLRNEQDAEDSFQATFLLLARKAASIRKRGSVGSWLYGVAYHLASRAREQRARRQAWERRAATMRKTEPGIRSAWLELQAALDESLGALPEKYRAALVLCYLEGRSHEEATRLLGCPLATFRSRLARGRQRLRAELTRRGLALSAAGSATLLAAGAGGAALPAAVLRPTLTAAARFAAGEPATRVAPPSVARLVEGGLKTMTTHWKVGLAVSVVLGLFATGAVLAAREALAGQVPPARPAPSGGAAAGRMDEEVRRDRDGEPLPDEAVARLGTTRFRHGGPVAHLAFTPDSKTLVSFGSWTGARVWDVATGKETRRFPDQTFPQGVSLSPDGKSLAVLIQADDPRGGPIVIRDFATGRLVRRFGKPGRFNNVLFSPDGKALAVFGWANTVELWDPLTGRPLHTLEGHTDIVWSAVFSQDGKGLVSCADDRTIRFWDVTTGKQVRQITHAERVWKIALSHDGKLLASVDVTKKTGPRGGATVWLPDHRVRLWDAHTGKELRQLAIAAKELLPGVRAGFSHVGFAPDGKTVVTGETVDGTLRFWDPATGRELRRVADFAGTVGPFTFSPDGKSVAVGHGNSVVRPIDLASGKDLAGGHGHQSFVSSVAVMRDGRSVVTTGGDGTLRVWDAATGRELRRRAVPGLDRALPGGTTYLAVGDDKGWRAHDLETGKELAVLRGHERNHSALSPDRRALATCGPDRVIRLIDPATGRTRHELMKVDEAPAGMSFSSDGRLLVAWHADKSVTVWDAATGKKLRQFAGPAPPEPGTVPPGRFTYTAALSRDGGLLAFGLQALIPRQRFLPVLETATGKEVCRFRTGEDGACRLQFSPDGKSLAWGGWRDGTVYLGEVATGGVRRRFTGHRGRIYSLGFAADGSALVSGSEDSTAMVWDLTGRLATGDGWGKALSEGELKAQWADLAGEDAAAGYRAIQVLAADPVRSVPYLRERLRPIVPVDEKRLRRLIADLNSEQFRVRQKATEELERLGEAALSALRGALDGRPTVETRRRLEGLIEKQERQRWSRSPERLRALRAMEVLERAGTPEARRVLEALAAGAPGAWLTQDAKGALTRTGRQ